LQASSTSRKVKITEKDRLFSYSSTTAPDSKSSGDMDESADGKADDEE
jgi:hypothetical protein